MPKMGTKMNFKEFWQKCSLYSATKHLFLSYYSCLYFKSDTLKAWMRRHMVFNFRSKNVMNIDFWNDGLGVSSKHHFFFLLLLLYPCFLCLILYDLLLLLLLGNDDVLLRTFKSYIFYFLNCHAFKSKENYLKQNP